MPYNGVPIGCDEDRSAARLQDAKCLSKNTIDLRNVLGNLRTYDDIKRRFCLIYFSRVADGI